MSYGEWGAAWWQWAIGQPAAVNPVTDTTGEYCDQGQSGSVWFLAGTFGTDDVERSCTIPPGTALFFPIYNWIYGAGVFDCEPTNPDVPCDVDALMAAAAVQTELAEEEDVPGTVFGDVEFTVTYYLAVQPGSPP